MPSLAAPGPRLAVTTPALGTQLLPIAASVRMAEGEHQIATLTVLTPLQRDRRLLDAAVPASLVLAEGTAVSFTFGSSLTDTATWCGYVASRQIQHTRAQAHNAGAAVVPVTYTCTGISMPMQSALSRAYSGISASAAARRVLGDYGLAAFIQPHPRIWPALAQGSASDFAWLCQLACMIGYRVVVDVDRVYFAPAEADLTPPGAAGAVFTRNVVPGVYDTLIAFDPAAGQTDPSGAVAASVAAFAVRPSSGVAHVAGAVPRIAPGGVAPYFTRIASGSARSYSDAAYNAAAQAAQARYWVYADATVDGRTSLRAGRTVQLAGAALTAAEQGRWRISTVTHAVNLSLLGRGTSTYYARLELGRDQDGALNLAAPHPPPVPAPAPILTGGRWICPGAGGGA